LNLPVEKHSHGLRKLATTPAPAAAGKWLTVSVTDVGPGCA
jgi:hypothetical protein